jgi:hypothetical protein
MRYRVLALTALLCCWPVVVVADEETYAERLARRPMPTDEAGRKAECGWIRQEAARLQSALIASEQMMNSQVQTNLTPIYRAALRGQYQQAGAALETRAADVGCTAAFSNAPAPPAQQQGMSFDECFQKCKQYTSRTNEQCFDACKTSGVASAPNVTGSSPSPLTQPSSGNRRIGDSCSGHFDCQGTLHCDGGRCVARSDATPRN